MEENMLKQRWSLFAALVVIATLVLAACQPQTVVVEKEVKVTEIVKEVVKETVVVEGTPQVVEKEVTKVVEVQVTPTPAPSEKPVTLNLNLGNEPPQVDPALSTDNVSIAVDEQLFLGLTDFAEDNTVLPELATDWSVSADGLVWTFNMRDDVPWVRYNPATGETVVMTDEEGNPEMVDAHDVEYAVKRTLNPVTGSDYAYVLYIIEGALAVNSGEEEDLDTIGVRAVDDYTVEFTLRAPAGYFPAIAGMWVARPVYQPVIDEYGARWIEPGIIVTNGPYLMESWQHFDSMTFVKNPEFYDADKVQI
jgi:ABC-type oligopeptide transport system substrate-binding subunit